MKQKNYGLIIAAAVLLLALCVVAAPVAAYGDNKVYLGPVYAYGLYDFDYPDLSIDLGIFSTWTDSHGNSVTFIRGEDEKYYIDGYAVYSEGFYSHYLNGVEYIIDVKQPSIEISGSIYQKPYSEEYLGELIGSDVPNDKYIVIDQSVGDVAYTNPTGTLTTIAPENFDLYVDGSSNLKRADLGVWTVQAYFKKGCTYDSLGGVTITQYAPNYLLGKPYYFTIIGSDIPKKLETSTEEVVRGGYADITLTAPMGNWRVSVENGSIPEGQPNVYNIDTRDGLCYADISVPSSGSSEFSVQSTSSSNIKVKLYNQDFDRVVKSLTIKVIPGTITATTDDSAVIIGDEIDIEGTNDLGGTLYFFIKGTYYPLTVVMDWYDSILTAYGKEWSATIDTFNLKKPNGENIDAGTYTIYVVKLADGVTVDQISDAGDLGNAELVSAYATVSVGLQQPFITITKVPEIIIQGEGLEVSGTAAGILYDVQYYLFGANYFNFGYAPVDDGEFTVYLDEAQTQRGCMPAGQYFLVIQHPMYDGIFNIGAYTEGTSQYQAGDVVLNTYGPWNLNNKNCVTLFNALNKTPANAAQSLCDALDSQDIDDLYVRASFIVAGLTSYIYPIPSQITKGDILAVSGETTGHVGDIVTVELLSTAYTAIPKKAVGSDSFISVSTRIDEAGLWSVFIDTSGLNADEYICSVTVEQLAAATSNITIVEGTIPQNPTYTVTVNSTDNGFAFALPPSAVAGTLINLYAYPDYNCVFKEWQVVSGGVTVVDDQFTMPANDVEINAVFEEIPTYTVTVNHTGQGLVLVYPTSAVAGTVVTLSATPLFGWSFKEWQVVSGGISVVDDQFTMPANDVEINAVFEEIPTYTVTVNYTGQGLVLVYPTSAVAGTVVTLSTIPSFGWIFKEWQVVSGGISVVDDQFTMPANDVEINAVFEEVPTYAVTVKSLGNGFASASPSLAAAGTLITLTATPDADYKLKEWQVVEGGVTITGNKFTMPENDVRINAFFEKVLISANKNAAIVEETTPASLPTLTVPLFTNSKSGKSIPLDDGVVVKAVIGGVEQTLSAKIVGDKVVLDNPDAADEATNIKVEFIGKKLGDSDGDGQVTVNDAVKVAQSLVSIVELNEKGEFYGDADSDGLVTVNDAVKVAQRLVELVDENYE